MLKIRYLLRILAKIWRYSFWVKVDLNLLSSIRALEKQMSDLWMILGGFVRRHFGLDSGLMEKLMNFIFIIQMMECLCWSVCLYIKVVEFGDEDQLLVDQFWANWILCSVNYKCWTTELIWHWYLPVPIFTIFCQKWIWKSWGNFRYPILYCILNLQIENDNIVLALLE